jgi:hypothetical protein
VQHPIHDWCRRRCDIQILPFGPLW